MWLPPSSGLRERIAAVHAAHPNGFVRLRRMGSIGEDGAMPNERITSGHSDDGPVDFALAELSLLRYQALRRAKLKLRAAIFLMRLGRAETARRLSASEESPSARTTTTNVSARGEHNASPAATFSAWLGQ